MYEFLLQIYEANIFGYLKYNHQKYIKPYIFTTQRFKMYISRQHICFLHLKMSSFGVAVRLYTDPEHCMTWHPMV